MKKTMTILTTTLSALTLMCVLGGCDQTVSRESSTEVKKDGTVKTKEETVTRNPDGTVTKEETEKKTEPVNP